ncbi:branched-chain amino acid aminotransferase [Bacillus sp. CECT 9360]|uniref:branched-chain amino acid aminotransferase n=1 Tax=Bacillus sp. CECT 9360 TaxID=2845821 RepID=UPI001E4DB803|nr:branched-chain amino acid aminotransferase [Bacillus sp. CECT 9360]
MKSVEEQQSSQKGDAIIVHIYKEEKEYAEKHQLIAEELRGNITLAEPVSRFSDAHIERCDKESEEVITIEKPQFLTEPIEYLKKHKNEFIYLESDWWELVGVDAVSLEADDVFGTYNIMLGLKLQKKFGTALKTHLKNELHGDDAKFSLLFNPDEGLWNLNFALDYTGGFKEELSIGEAYNLIYHFLFKLVEVVEHKENSPIKEP